MTLEGSKLAVYSNCDERSADAQSLAERLNLPVVHMLDDSIDYLLAYTEHHLELRRTGREAPGPVYVDFLQGRLGYRGKRINTKNEPLAKAVGLKPGYRPEIIDATAGLGRDSFVLATLGCRVRLLERSPVIAALLRDGIERSKCDADTGSISANLTLIEADAISYLSSLEDDERPDVIYLDPMYPHSSKSALVKKEMRYFREIVGADEDADRLLAVALGKAFKRVVVKRPRLAKPLHGCKPTGNISGKTTRFDIYSIT